MQRAAGNQRGLFRSFLYMGEVLHQNGLTEKAVDVGMRAQEELRLYGSRQELGVQLNNLAS